MSAGLRARRRPLACAHRGVEKLAAGRATYNLGTGRPNSVREIISAVEGLALKVPVVEDARRAGDPPALYADSSKANGAGWEINTRVRISSRLRGSGMRPIRTATTISVRRRGAAPRQLLLEKLDESVGGESADALDLGELLSRGGA